MHCLPPTTFMGLLLASASPLLAAPSTAADNASSPPNVLMGSRDDQPFRTNSPMMLSDNRLAFSRIGLTSERGLIAASADILNAVDTDPASGMSLPADGSQSLEIRFIGQPRWLNIIEIEGTLRDASVEMLHPDGRWRVWGDAQQDTDATLIRTGAAGRYLGVRITPTGLSSAAQVEIAEARGRFEQTDADRTSRVEGDGPSYFYEWVENYSSSPLSNTSEDATWLGNQLPSSWDVLGYGNGLAWERDFKRAAYGGTNNDFVDEHDLVFFSGHGSTASGEYYSDSTRCITFSNSSYNDSALTAGDAYDSWGDDDMEWIGMSACQTMKQDRRWAAAMNGVHLVMGWQTNMYDVDNFGKKFAKRMVDSGAFDSAHPVKSSWFHAAEKTHGHVDRTAEVIGETTSMGSDYLWGEGSVNSDPADDRYYTRWSYNTRGRQGQLGHQPQDRPDRAVSFAGDALSLTVGRDVLDAARAAARPHILSFFAPMPTVDADSTAALANTLCQRLGFGCQVDIGPDGDNLEMIAVSGNQEIRIWKGDGGIDVIDRTVFADGISDQVVQLLPLGEARERATAVLNTLGVSPEDRIFAHEDFFWQEAGLSKDGDGRNDNAVEAIPLRTRTIFRRQINGLPTWGPGGEATVEFGDQGRLAKASVQAWTPLEAGPQVQLMDVEPLLETIARRGHEVFLNPPRQPLDHIQVDAVEIGYWINNASVGRQTIEPCYGLSCTVRNGNGEPTGMMLVVNATVPAPQIDLEVENGVDGCLAPGAPVCLNAIVNTYNGGYEIEWIDQSAGALVDKDTPSLCHVFPEDLARSTHLHTMEVRIRDDRGQTRSATATVCVRVPGDLDGNHVVDIEDLLLVLGAWESIGDPFTGGDADGDGTCGIEDLLLILARWNS